MELTEKAVTDQKSLNLRTFWALQTCVNGWSRNSYLYLYSSYCLCYRSVLARSLVVLGDNKNIRRSVLRSVNFCCATRMHGPKVRIAMKDLLRAPNTDLCGQNVRQIARKRKKCSSAVIGTFWTMQTLVKLLFWRHGPTSKIKFCSLKKVLFSNKHRKKREKIIQFNRKQSC